MPDDPFDSVESAIDDITAGRLVIVVDDEDRENEGDLIMAASKATPETVNMMIRHGRGLICVPTVEPQLKRLGLNPMVANNRESHRTDFTVCAYTSRLCRIANGKGFYRWIRFGLFRKAPQFAWNFRSSVPNAMKA